MSDIYDKVKQIRSLMAAQGVDACIITGTDPHQSEYLAPCWNDREWLTGFTGSAGCIVITNTFAGLWTDSRYYIQAAQELSYGPFEMMKQDPKTPFSYILWCKENLPENAVLAIDGFDISQTQFQSFKKMLPQDAEIRTDLDLIGQVWINRPTLPMSQVFALEVQYCGSSVSEKLTFLQNFLEENNIDLFLVTALDEIAWLLNLRGSDVLYNPVFVAYLLVGQNENTLFVDDSRFSPPAMRSLKEANVGVSPYGSIISHLNGLDEKTQIGLDSNLTSVSVYKACNGNIKDISSPIQLKKSIKNDTEIANTQQVMVQDGVALAKAFFWLHETLKTRTISEFEFSQKVSQERSLLPGYLGDSFAPIIGYQGNGAIVHYHPDKNNSAIIQPTGVLLVDSGGQYLTGTTDITRTISLSGVTKNAQRSFTLVLKGMIALSKAVFPVGTTGMHLDILARQFLWQNGQNYGHGTGHGVGFCLNVHEGPQSIAGMYNQKTKTPMMSGMITSNEPGYYEADQYGVRVENLVLTVPHPQFPNYLKFETLTYYPIDIQMIDETYLDSGEKAWFNSYHHKVKSLILPHLDGPIRSWFELKCRPLN